MINRIKISFISLWKLYKAETTIYALSVVLFYIYKSSYLMLSVIILILGTLSFLTSILCRKVYLDKYLRFFYAKPFFSSRYILFQSSNICRYNCQDVLKTLYSKNKVKQVLYQLPKGKYKSITHISIIKVVEELSCEIHVSNVIYSDKLSKIRSSTLGKECPCADDVDCKYKKHIISAQTKKDNADFHYIEFTIK